MATTASNFIKVATSTLHGTTYTTAPYVAAFGPKEAAALEVGDQSGNVGGICVDRVTVDLSLTAVPTAGTPQQVPDVYGTSLGAYAKNGTVLLSLTGTTPFTIDLTDLTLNTPASYAGDTTFSKANVIVFNNLGAGAVVITTGASTPAGLPTFNGTSAGDTVAASSVQVHNSKAGVTVDSTHKLIVCTPAATTTLAISVGGS